MLLFAYITKAKMEESYLDGVADGVIVSKKYAMDRDKVCPAWLFQTNLREAKTKICGGKRG
jgi:hypothetical protein